ncbi:T9SS type A sorting domain-containing protein [Formosa sediminum]|uniref:T9SS type A sorting domain-containing protein n=1 Tax=Formosa sediminum TaxID=2594004 RepID=A0A516GNA4_9FLAO|nr:T9SS type A sorting domain-containing protein [Formosa sediminum]QDO93012.1 T9SS type A sorting domain-containing protein [Formosa sediminum]
MKNKLQIALGLLAVVTIVFALAKFKNEDVSSNKQEVKTLTVVELKALHKKNLENSPFKNTASLSKKERAQKGLPPKRYMERLWELTMNPALGRPTPENLTVIQKELLEARSSALAAGRVPGDDSNNNWIERGPNDIGGRTRALIFDPNDTSNETVLAGGVSGGLWKNTNISNPNSVWTSVDLPENLNISCIAVDPNDSKTMYLGTGESYVAGDVNGNGVWKSTDGGNSWSHVFGGAEGETVLRTDSKVTVKSPSSIADTYIAISAGFSPTITSDITKDVVLADAGGVTGAEACSTLTNAAAINGKIALIYRGGCSFIEKVVFAQDAGAVAVIVVNNVSGNPIAMGGVDLNGEVLIPSVMVSKTNGDLMLAQLEAGQTVNATISATSVDFSGLYVLNGNQHVNDIIVRDNNGVSEVFVAAGSSFYSDATPYTLFGPDDYGLFKSSNGGTSWSQLAVPLTDNGYVYEPNDIELGADNTIWMSTRQSLLYGDGGGTIFSSTDGNNFVKKYEFDGSRTQIATSHTDANKVYILAEGKDTITPVIMKKTINGFASTTDLTLPNDADTDIDEIDFCRGQAFYDLVIKVDPTNDEKVYVGGIDAFRSADGGTTWTQLSHWYGGFGYPDMHADQHAIAFGTGDSSKMLFGNDGGVFYSSASGSKPTSRNNGYNVTQFYTVAVAPTAAVAGDYFAGGTQDNGTPYFRNASSGINSSSFDLYGGDGAYTAFDQDGTDTYVISNYIYNLAIRKYDYATGEVTTIHEDDEEEKNGEFINPQILDSRLNYLFSNYSSGTSYAIKTYRTKSTTSSYIANTLTNTLLDAPALALAISPYDVSSSHSILYAGLENGRLLKITNASAPIFQSWSDISSSEFVGSISDIEFGTSTNEMYVTFHNYGVNNIWYTSDGGTTWSKKDGNLPDMPVKTILRNPLKADEVIIGTELGVWYTTNFSSDSPTWTSAFNGMSNVKVMDLDLRDDNTIFAATFGRGLFSGKFTSEALSVEDNVLATGISLYPTVSTGEFKVKSKSNLGDVNLQIFNLNGQSVLVKTINLDGNTATDININVASGVYLAKFTEGETTTIKKFIIK